MGDSGLFLITVAKEPEAKEATTREPWRIQRSSVLLRVRLTPKGGRDAIEGCAETGEGLAVKARVRAAPENGAANAALEALVAEWVGVPRRDVALASGTKSRTKTVALTGNPQTLAARLRELIATLAP